MSHTKQIKTATNDDAKPTIEGDEPNGEDTTVIKVYKNIT